MGFASINPATGRELHSYPIDSPSAVETALATAVAAQEEWRALPVAARARHLRNLARTLRRKRDHLAALATAEMGKPILQSLGEVEKCAACCEHFAAHAGAWLRPERPAGAPKRAQVVHVPMGVVLAIMPWNFPYWQVFRSGVPALAAGNVFLLKHAAGVTGCALACADIVREAGLPAGVLQTIVVEPMQVGTLIADPRVAAVALTGSTTAGRRVAALAGAAMKKGVYELGGSDPYLVLADADVARAAAVCVESRLVNTGQTCVAAKRLIVVESVREEFEQRVVTLMAAARLGDPTDPATEIGPLARADLRARLHAQVRGSMRRGAKLLLGGKVPRGPGFFYPPTVLTGVSPGMPACDEELFGPVAAILPVPDEEAAIRLANASSYGLGAAVFTRDHERGLHIARDRLQAGLAFVNDRVRSDACLPFGGIKASGYGRELGLHGLREFTHPKTVWSAAEAPAAAPATNGHHVAKAKHTSVVELAAAARG